MKLRISLVLFMSVLFGLTCTQSFGLPQVSDRSGCSDVFVVAYQHVTVEVFNSLVRTNMTLDIINTSKNDIPCKITLGIPKNARATSLSAVIDGKTFTAVIKGKQVARDTVDDAREKGLSAALVEEVFKGELHYLNIELSQVKGEQDVRLDMSYIEEAKWDNDHFSYVFSLKKAESRMPKFNELTLGVDFKCSTDILNVSSPTHKLTGTYSGGTGSYVAEVSPLVDGDFQLLYGLKLLPGVPVVLANTTEANTYFNMLYMPPVEELHEGKLLHFLIDKSGSMQGKKFACATVALMKLVANLEPKDSFNVSFFNTEHTSFTKDFNVYVNASEENRNAAMEYIKAEKMGGGTRFLQPLANACVNIKDVHDMIPAVVLLTDGRDNCDKAASFINNLKESTNLQVPVFIFGIGSDLDLSLLRTLSRMTRSELYTVLAPADIGKATADFGKSLAAITARDFAVMTSDFNNTTIFPARLAQLYNNEPVSVTGKTARGENSSILVSARGSAGVTSHTVDLSILPVGGECDFLRAHWANKRIQLLMDDLMIFGHSYEKVDEIKKLSVDYLITTPYTSLVFTEGKYAEEKKEENLDGIEFEEEDGPLSEDFLGALGVGAGSPTGAYGNRKGGGRKKTAKKKGGSDASESSVDLGLKWLADNQEGDGHWDSAKFGGDVEHEGAANGLNLLSFAGAGHTERSGKYRKTVSSTIQWLSTQQDTQGCFAPGKELVNHAIPTLALLEEVAMAPVPRTKAMAERALKYLLSCQNKYKGWGATAGDTKNDLYTTTWALMCLKAAKVPGMDVPAGAWAGAKAFVDEVTDPATGMAGRYERYIAGITPASEAQLMTACSLLCRLYLGEPRDSAVIKLAIENLMKNLPEWKQPSTGDHFYEYWYFSSLVLFQIEGEQWKKWNEKMRPMLVDNAEKTIPDLKGTWEPQVKPLYAPNGGRLSSTAFSSLSLEVYYRYEIIHR